MNIQIIDENEIYIEVGDSLTRFKITYLEYENELQIELEPDYSYDRLQITTEDILGDTSEIKEEIINVTLKLLKKKWD